MGLRRAEGNQKEWSVSWKSGSQNMSQLLLLGSTFSVSLKVMAFFEFVWNCLKSLVLVKKKVPIVSICSYRKNNFHSS
jgi:hypothetical protein